MTEYTIKALGDFCQRIYHLVGLFGRLLGNCSCLASTHIIHGVMRCNSCYIAHYIRQLLCLEYEPKTCAKWHSLFRQSPEN